MIYSFDPKHRKYIEGYVFMSFANNMGKNIIQNY